jgi:uncharacterized membrane protein
MPSPHGPVGVFVAVYDSEDLADAALEEVRSLEHRLLMLDVYDQAKILRRADGKVEVHPAHGTRKGAKRGLVAGAVVGLVFPPSLLVTGALGAAGGAGIGKLRSGTLKERFLGDLGTALQPGRAAVVIITDAHQLETVSEFVPPPLSAASQAFATGDSDEIRGWLTSLAAGEKAS